MKGLLTVLLVLMMSGLPAKPTAPPTVQLALLIDLSGSMDGLLTQAQTQLWQLLNYTHRFQYAGQPPQVEVAVLTYGNESGADNGHIELISDFTRDIDAVADRLFVLQAIGSVEYCGLALQRALDSLSWRKEARFRGLFIVGNEGFDQGPVDFRQSCRQADSLGIIVNTIYCGAHDRGIGEGWSAGASAGGGRYTHMEQDIDLDRLRTPYDQKLVELYLKYMDSDLSGPTLQPNPYYYLPDGKISPAFRDRIIYKFRYDPPPPALMDTIDLQHWQPDSLSRRQLPPHLQKLEEGPLRWELLKRSQERDLTRRTLQHYIRQAEEYLETVLQPEELEQTLSLAIQGIMREQLLAAGFSR